MLSGPGAEEYPGMYTIVLESPELSVKVIVTVVGCGGKIHRGTVVLIESD